MAVTHPSKDYMDDCNQELIVYEYQFLQFPATAETAVQVMRYSDMSTIIYELNQFSAQQFTLLARNKNIYDISDKMT
jgi:hypothetical protein